MQVTCIMIQITLKYLLQPLPSKTLKCFKECKTEDKKSLYISYFKTNLLMELFQTILFLKSKAPKNLMKSFLLVAILILGTLDHKQEPMMMQEDLSLFLKLSDFFLKMDLGQKEHSDLSLGVAKNGEEIKLEPFNTFKNTSMKLTTISLLLKVIWEALNFTDLVIQELELI